MPTDTSLSTYADEHAGLLQVINKHDGVQAAIKDATDLLTNVQQELAVRNERLKTLTKKRKMERKDYDNLLRSQLKQFFVRLNSGGKEGLSQRLDKEEREYIEALQNEHNEERIIAELQETEKAVIEQKATLEAHAAERSRSQKRLQDIYRSAFTGPTPEFPEEDAAEDNLKQAEALYDRVDAGLKRENRALALIDKAAQFATATVKSLESANRAATMDTFGWGGIWAEMAERDDLLRAQSNAVQSQASLRQARQLHPEVRLVQPGEIVQPEWLNVIFDNFWTDIMFQQKIKKSIQNAINYQRAIFEERQKSQARAASLQQPLRDAQEHMQACRRELVAIRREILTRIAEDAQDAPPSYTSAVDGSRVIEEREVLAATVVTESTPSYYLPPPSPPPELSRPSQSHGTLSTAHSSIRGHSPSRSFASNNPYRNGS